MLKGEVNRFNINDVSKTFYLTILELIGITDFVAMDFQDNYISESNRIKDMYSKMNHMEKNKSKTKEKDNAETLVANNEVFVKKLWNYDFFGVT